MESGNISLERAYLNFAFEALPGPVNGSVNWCSHSGEYFGSVFQNVRYVCILFDLAFLFSDICIICMHLHSSI